MPGNRRYGRGRKEKKRLAPTRLDMPVFESTDPNAEVMYMLWWFNVGVLLDQYEATHFFESEGVSWQVGVLAAQR